MKRTSIIIALAIVMYIMAAGPWMMLGFYVGKRFGGTTLYSVVNVVDNIFYPHGWVSARWEWYHNYSMWWAKKGGMDFDWTWEQQRSAFGLDK